MVHVAALLLAALLAHAVRLRPRRVSPTLLVLALVLVGAAPVSAATGPLPGSSAWLRSNPAPSSPFGGGGMLPAGTGGSVLRRMFPQPHPYLHDPIGWIRDKLGENPLSYQGEICASVAEKRYTVVPACHGPGKSYIASRLIAWWVDVHEASDTRVIFTAPRWYQVDTIIGGELRELYARHPQLGQKLDGAGKLTKNGIAVGGGRKPADHDQFGFSGIHRTYVLAIGDEGCGLVENIVRGLRTILTGPHCRMLLIGNPDDPATEFQKACRPGSGFNVIPINALRTPNFTKDRVAPYPRVRLLMEEHGIPYSTEPVDDRVRATLVDPLWVDEAITAWGIGSAAFTSKVLGVFPKVSKDTLITPTMLNHALNRVDLSGMKKGQYGTDIARYGPDRTVVYRNRGGQVRFRFMCGQQSTDTTTGELRAILDETPDVPMVMDSVGIGGPVFDYLVAEGYALIGFGDKGSLKDSARFVDARSELYFTAREMFAKGLIDLDPDDELVDQLCAELQEHRYFHTRDGRIRVESKDELKKRLGRSPDLSDAFVYSLIDASADLSAFEDAAEHGPASVASEFIDRVM